MTGTLSWFFLAGLIVLSAGGLFRPAFSGTALQILWLFGFLGFLVLIPVRRIRRGDRISGSGTELLALSLLLVNFVTQLTGGLASFLLPFYLMVTLLASLRLGIRVGLFSAGLSVLLEIGNYFHDPSPWKEVLLYPLLLLVTPFAVRSYLGVLNREKLELRQRVERMDGELGFLGDVPGLQEQVGADRLSEEEQEGETLSLVRQMASAMKGLLRVTYEAALAVPPAFTPSEPVKLFETPPEIHTGLVLLFDRNRQGFWVTASIGSGDILLQKERLLPVREEGCGLLGWFMKEQRTLSVSNFDRQRGGPGYYVRPVPIASLLVVPLLNKEVVEGLICFDSLSPGFFSDGHERLVEGIAQEMVYLLRMFRERQHVLKTALQFSALLTISRHLSSSLDVTHRLLTTAEEAHKIVPYDQCFIFLVEPGERRAIVKVAKGYDPKILDYRFGLTNGLLSLLVKNRQPLLFPVLNRPRRVQIFPDACKINVSSSSFLGIPLVVEEHVIGVVLFLSDSKQKFTAYHQHILTLLCSHVALSIAEAQLHHQVKHLATVDGLTGTFNHRRLQERLEEEVVRIQRHPDFLSLLMVDIDHFKKINDTYGHPAGDAVLKKIAKTLMRLVRKTDLVSRYGGEEFCLLLVKTPSGHAEKLAERIRNTIAQNPVSWKGETIPVTVSIGVASCPDDSDNREGLLIRADRALYVSKNGGRNRVTVFGRLGSGRTVKNEKT